MGSIGQAIGGLPGHAIQTVGKFLEPEDPAQGAMDMVAPIGMAARARRVLDAVDLADFGDKKNLVAAVKDRLGNIFRGNPDQIHAEIIEGQILKGTETMDEIKRLLPHLESGFVDRTRPDAFLSREKAANLFK